MILIIIIVDILVRRIYRKCSFEVWCPAYTKISFLHPFSSSICFEVLHRTEFCNLIVLFQTESHPRCKRKFTTIIRFIRSWNYDLVHDIHNIIFKTVRVPKNTSNQSATLFNTECKFLIFADNRKFVTCRRLECNAIQVSSI